ncbi:calcium/sodium antiporter [Nocardia testacea]|uniref:Calcium/sodium antiporter n=1 Tax=Nocardia testacea TaxID=248551 RepID=A0ABW7W7G7_9NOCA
MTPWLPLGAGLLALVVGAELVVRSGTRLALRWSIPPVVIGLTVVALGTSAPELAVGIDAAIRGNGPLAVGNLIGTNLVNLLLILGASAVLTPIALSARTTTIDGPAVLVVSVLVLICGFDARFTRAEAVVLLLAGLVYLAITFRTARRGDAPALPVDTGARPFDPSTAAAVRDCLLLATGLAVIVVGADLLVRGAVELARDQGISEAVIGLTVVAIGTSAPELVTTVVSTLRGNRDIALGNLLGSSVLNIAVILGATILAAPAPIDIPGAVAHIDIPIMTGSAVLVVLLFRTGRRLSRLEGALFVTLYLGYLGYLLATRV